MPALIVVGEVVQLQHARPVPTHNRHRRLWRFCYKFGLRNGYGPKRLTHLRQLEAESIHIIREVAAEFSNPVMMYSIGKDSSVMLRRVKRFIRVRCRSRCCTWIPAGNSARCTSFVTVPPKPTAASCWCTKPGRGGDGYQPVRARQRQAYRHHENRRAEAGAE